MVFGCIYFVLSFACWLVFHSTLPIAAVGCPLGVLNRYREWPAAGGLVFVLARAKLELLGC